MVKHILSASAVFSLFFAGATGNPPAALTKTALWVKLAHIPFYLGIFLLGGVLILVMAVPIFTIVSPLLVMLMVFCDYLLLLTSSWYAVSAVRLLWSRGRISLFGALCCTLCLCCFVLDFFAAWYLRRTVRSCPE